MIIRVAEPGRVAFQLRKGEAGISVFDTEAVEPALTDEEILDCFRSGSVLVRRSRATITGKNLQIMLVEGSANLPERVRFAHAEIQPPVGMTRVQFKAILKDLE